MVMYLYYYFLSNKIILILLNSNKFHKKLSWIIRKWNLVKSNDICFRLLKFCNIWKRNTILPKSNRKENWHLVFGSGPVRINGPEAPVYNIREQQEALGISDQTSRVSWSAESILAGFGLSLAEDLTKRWGIADFIWFDVLCSKVLIYDPW